MAHEITYLKTIFKIDKGKLIWIKNKKKTLIGKQAGYINNYGYRMVEHKGMTAPVHRIIYALHYGEWPKNQIDHINGKKDDNRIENLRDVTARENSGNRLKNINGKLVGAYYHKRDKRWHCQIKINGKSTYISTHKTELEAHYRDWETIGRAHV